MRCRLIPVAAAVAAAFAGLLAATPALATNGYLAHGYGIKAVGMGGASIALPQDAIAAAYNPAGMAYIGNRFDFGLTWFMPGGREATIVGSPAPFNNTSYDGDGTSNFFIPEFGYNRMIDDKLSVGVSVYGNGGMNTDYNKPFPLFCSSPPNPSCSTPGVDLSQLFVAPTVGYKITPEHMVGASLNLAYQRFKATGLQNFTAPSGPMQFSAYPSNVTDQGYDNSYGYGFRIGYLGQITPQVAIGATYQSKTWMTEFDSYKGLFAEQGGFDIPASYGLGVALKPTRELEIAFDVVWIDYSGIKSINNPLLPNLFQARLGTDGGAGFGWEDMTVYKLGIQYAVNPQLTLRGGYNYGKQPIPDSETLFNVLAPGSVESHWTLGATWTLANKSELSFSFMYAPSVTVNGVNSIPPAFGGGNVNLSLKEMSLGIAYGWKF
jgi:long-chain fatty acid transport protein